MYGGHKTTSMSPKPGRIEMSWSPVEKRIPSWPNTTLTKLNGLLIICRTQGGKLLRFQRLECFPPWYLHCWRYTTGRATTQTGYVLSPPPTATTDDDHTPCASGGKTVPTLPLRMPSPCTERASPLTTLVRDNNPRSGARLANRGARGTTPSAQLAAALHGAGGKTASTLPLRMPSPCTERAPPLTTLARDNNPRSGARLASREARGTTPAAQLVAASRGAGGKTSPTLPLRMPWPCTERAPPLKTLARGNNRWSGARLTNQGARGITPPAWLAAALHGAG